jgi:peptidoglycan/xylan/chitin deacetylase (PgdA/CDA1 family)
LNGRRRWAIERGAAGTPLRDMNYYRAEPPSAGPPRRRRGRRSIWPVVALVAVFAVVLLAVLAAVPWFGHLGLPWPGAGTASGTSTQGVTVSGIRIDGSDTSRHDGKVLVRFTTRQGQPAVAQWRVDGGPWHKGRIAFVKAPADHGNDGAHVMEVRAAAGGPVVKYTVQVDTAAPDITWITARPARISGPKDLTLAYDVAAEKGVTVTWAVVDALGRETGEQGSPHAAAGTETVTWAAKSKGGGALFPGTYRFAVTAADAAGNETSATVHIACDAPRAAKLILSVPKAGKLVALSFDGGSGYAWRHIMRTLAKLKAGGTFFCTGVSVNKYPEVAREALSLGMEIGNHSYDHPDFTTITYEEARRQLLDNADTWWEACRAIPAPLFRPPYGAYDATTLKAAGSAGYPFVVNWDVDTGDWTGASPAVVARRAVDGAGPGSIICMHTEWNTQKAIPAIVKGLRAKGLEPVSVGRLLEAGGLL